VGIQPGSANAQHVCAIADHKHSARNTCLYERIFIQFLRPTKDEDTQLCQQSLHVGCPNDRFPLLTWNVQNNPRTSSSRQAASSIPRVCSTSRLVPLAGIKSHRYATVGITDDVRIIKTRFINNGPRTSAEKLMFIEGTEEGKVHVYAFKAYCGRKDSPTHF